MWYFPNALPLNQHQKMFLMNPGWERSGTVGFRCVADSTPLPPAPPPPPPPPPCTECTAGGQPCLCVVPGTKRSGEAPPYVSGTLDLAAERNALDWVGVVPKESGVVHKATAAAAAATAAASIVYGVVGASEKDVVPYCCSPLSSGWAGGGAAPHTAQVPTGSGLYVQRTKGGGFSLRVSVPPAAAASVLNLTLFAGCWSASCSLHAELESEEAPMKAAADSNNAGEATSLPAPQDRRVSVGKDVVMFRWEVMFKVPENAGTTTLVLNWEDEDGDGNVTFQAAILNVARLLHRPGTGSA